MDNAKDARTPLLSSNKAASVVVIAPPADPSQPVLSKDVSVAGIQVELYNDDAFREVRRHHGVPDNFLDYAGKDSINLKKCRRESAFGKGGDGQFATDDQKYVVKLIHGDDHKSLVRLAQAYAKRQLGAETLLVPIFAHFRRTDNGLTYIAMANLTPPREPAYAVKYDLKGCDDDKTLERKGSIVVPVRKRFYKLHLWFCTLCWSEARHTYFKGKVSARELFLGLPPDQRDEIVRIIEEDSKWLVDAGTMDYSLLLAIRRIPKAEVEAALLRPVAGTGLPDQAEGMSFRSRRYAYCDGNDVVVVTLGILDFLQTWTCPKKIAQCIKSCEFNKATVPPPQYGDRFAKHFAKRFRACDGLKALSWKVLEQCDAYRGRLANNSA